MRVGQDIEHLDVATIVLVSRCHLLGRVDQQRRSFVLVLGVEGTSSKCIEHRSSGYRLKLVLILHLHALLHRSSRLLIEVLDSNSVPDSRRRMQICE